MVAEIAKWEAVGDVDVGKKIKALKKKVRAGGGGDSCEGGVDELLVHVHRCGRSRSWRSASRAARRSTR